MLNIQERLEDGIYTEIFWNMSEDMIETLKKYFNEEDKELTTLNLMVDRGVHSFRELAVALKEYYPNLNKLVIKQDYSYYAVFHHFLNFVKDMKLDSLTIVDLQTEFFNEMTKENYESIRKVIKEDAKCILYIKGYTCNSCKVVITKEEVIVEPLDYPEL